jgi:hypothetical protein
MVPGQSHKNGELVKRAKRSGEKHEEPEQAATANSICNGISQRCKKGAADQSLICLKINARLLKNLKM